MPKATKEMVARNKLIVAEYNKLYTPIVKKTVLVTQLGLKYGLGAEAVRRIVNDTTAGRYLKKKAPKEV